MSPGPTIFDRKLLRVRQARARVTGPATFLLDRVADDVAERLSAVLRQFERAADIGTPTDALRRVLKASGKVGAIVAATSSPAAGEALRVTADEEALPFADASLDLVVSALALQFVNDLPGTLIQIRRALKPDGLLLAAMIGGDSLNELREFFAEAESEIEGGISPRVAPFADVRDLGGLLQRAGFALPVVDADRLTVRYDSPSVVDARPARHGRRQCADRASALAAQASYAEKNAGDLRAPFRRCRRPLARDL